MIAKQLKNPASLLVLVASLGYFVDIYDLVLFNVVKKGSLIALGYEGQSLADTGIFLFNMQMAGMLLGGILWGILGDTKGRLKVLFGSILMYSLANIANAYVGHLPSAYALDYYAVVRFLAGIGLAGELGAGITLVAETMHKEKRGYGTMIIVTFGALGAVLAFLVADKMDWFTAYWVGGLMGIALLLLRIGTLESHLFKSLDENKTVKKGAFLSLFTNRERFFKYLNCILIGLPVWFIVGVPLALAENFATELGIPFDKESNLTGEAIMYGYLGLSFGDLLSGLLSQLFRSRRRIVLFYLVFSLAVLLAFLFYNHFGLSYFYFLCFMLGTATGYWALFVTIASEQFGTNIRATVTTTVPNFVRGAVVPITFSYKLLLPYFASHSIIYSALTVGVVCIALAFIATLSVKETFSKDLDYVETL